MPKPTWLDIVNYLVLRLGGFFFHVRASQPSWCAKGVEFLPSPSNLLLRMRVGTAIPVPPFPQLFGFLVFESWKILCFFGSRAGAKTL